jgi:hypothetical protein
MLAAGAVCPAPGCGEINFAYHFADQKHRIANEAWEFMCSECGLKFVTFEEDLLFHSVRRDWLWAGHHLA